MLFIKKYQKNILYNNIPQLLGYSNDQIHSIETDYTEEWLDKGALN